MDFSQFNNICAPFYNMSKNRVFEKYTRFKDVITFFTFYPQFTNIALNRFSWDFPEQYQQLNGDFLERLCHYIGRCALIQDDTHGFMIVDFIPDKNYNMWYEPQKIEAVDIVSRKKIGIYNNEKFVIIPNNELWTPTDIGIVGFVDDIVQAYSAIDNNNTQQKFPVIFQGTKEQKEDLKALFKHINEQDPYIFLKKEFNIDGITKLDISAPYLVKDIYDYIDRKKADCMNFLGINNANTYKQSGITADEVNSNNDFIKNVIDSYTQPRLKALDKIKKQFPDLVNSSLKINMSDYDVSKMEVL